MIQQIEEKVVNRLRQVTSAIKQDGANQVSIITSTAERQAAIEFAKAGAMRPQIVGAALQKISQDPEIADTMFEILETQNIIDGKAEITLVPRDRRIRLRCGLRFFYSVGPPLAAPFSSPASFVRRKLVRHQEGSKWSTRRRKRTSKISQWTIEGAFLNRDPDWPFFLACRKPAHPVR
jgi:hypothetical protein